MRKFLLKGLGLAAAIFVLQLLFYAAFSPACLDYPLMVTLKDNANKAPLILYYGDSIIQSAIETDRDKRSIATLLQAQLKTPVVDASHPAYESEMFYWLTRYFQSQGGKASHTIVPFNLRSLSGRFDAAPRYGFKREKILLRLGAESSPLLPILQPLLILKAFDLEPKKTTPVPGDAYHTRYAFPLEPTHPRLRRLDDLVSLIRTTSVPVVYLTPIDYEEIERRGVPGMTRDFERNLVIVRNQVASSKIDCFVDLSKSLGSRHFSSFEHLRDTGRRFVAEELAKLIRNGRCGVPNDLG